MLLRVNLRVNLRFLVYAAERGINFVDSLVGM